MKSASGSFSSLGGAAAQRVPGVGQQGIEQLYAQAREADAQGNTAEAQALRLFAHNATQAMTMQARDREEGLAFNAVVQRARQHEADMRREAEARMQPAVDEFEKAVRQRWRAGNTVPGDPL